jgi:60S ribosome subunit biogenesis protein NIP7
MRSLTEEESKLVIEKLSKYVGRNITKLIERTGESYVFHLHKGHVYYVKESIIRKAENIPRKNLCSLGASIGKFTKSNKFHITITSLSHLTSLASHKVWVKNSAEMNFLYGNNILKSHIHKMSDNAPEHEGILVLNQNDLPLGFAVTAKSAANVANLDPLGIACFHQADIGEYIRDEKSIS